VLVLTDAGGGSDARRYCEWVDMGAGELGVGGFYGNDTVKVLGRGAGPRRPLTEGRRARARVSEGRVHARRRARWRARRARGAGARRGVSGPRGGRLGRFTN
jgi:hypothetical protein